MGLHEEIVRSFIDMDMVFIYLLMVSFLLMVLVVFVIVLTAFFEEWLKG